MTTPDFPHRFELELVVPGPLEQVWQAIASGEGISAWMMPADVEPRTGGAVAFHMGPDATSHGRVTAFEPPRRVVYEEDWAALVGLEGADVTPLVTEFLVEARSGGTCVVRVVTSAFGTGADWENELWEEMNTGWAVLLDKLRLYLTNFPGQQATPLWAGATFTGTPEASIAAVRDALCVEAIGDAVVTQGIRGHLERSIARHFLVRVDEPVPGFVSFFSFGAEGGSEVHLQGHLFSDRAAEYVARESPRWQTWIESVAADLAASTVRQA